MKKTSLLRNLRHRPIIPICMTIFLAYYPSPPKERSESIVITSVSLSTYTQVRNCTLDRVHIFPNTSHMLYKCYRVSNIWKRINRCLKNKFQTKTCYLRLKCDDIPNTSIHLADGRFMVDQPILRII